MKKLNQEIIRIISNNLINKGFTNDERKMISASIFSILFSNIKALTLLMEQDFKDSALNILRSVFEGYIDLLNLHKYEKYEFVILNEVYKNQISIYNTIKEGNRYLKVNNDISEDDIERWKNKKKEYESIIYKEFNNKTGRLNVYDKFENADMIDLYNGRYRSLCLSTHNSLINDRITGTKGTKQLIELENIFSEEEKNILYHEINSILIDSTKLLYNIIEKENKNLEVELDRLKEESYNCLNEK
jgi:hypothetical protein